MKTKKRAVETAFGGRNAAEMMLQKRSQQLFHHPNIPTSPEDSDLLSSSEEDSLDPTTKGVFTEIAKLKRSIPDMTESVIPRQSLIKLDTSLPTHHRRTQSTAVVITSALEAGRSRESVGRNSWGEASGDEMMVDSKVSEEP